jgi:hypothetical protein
MIDVDRLGVLRRCTRTSRPRMVGRMRHAGIGTRPGNPVTGCERPFHVRFSKRGLNNSSKKSLEGANRYKIDYSAVAGKSRCVTEAAGTILNINHLDGRGGGIRTPGPSAPKFDLQRTFNNLPGAGWHRKPFKGTTWNSYCGAKVGLFAPGSERRGYQM